MLNTVRDPQYARWQRERGTAYAEQQLRFKRQWQQQQSGVPGFERELDALLSDTERFVGAFTRGRSHHSGRPGQNYEARRRQAEFDYAEEQKQIRLEEAQFKASIPTGDALEGLCCVYGVVVEDFNLRFQPGCFKHAHPSEVLYWWEHNKGVDGKIGETAEITALYEITRKELPILVQLDYPEATGGLVVVRRYLDHGNGPAALSWVKSGGVIGLSVSYGFDDLRTTTRTENGRRITDVISATLREISDTRNGGACPGVIPVTGNRKYSILQGRYKRRPL